ncbi:chorismate mutase [Erythrobacter sp.]|uniref:chorismate mutase n=1 Tax=Erythrobacter sp. TaxID=1042 RepID=UPI003C7509F7
MQNSSKAPQPDDCKTMAEVREGVDATDRELIALLARRFGYMRAAARIKPDREAVRDEARKAAVIEAAVRDAGGRGLPEPVIGDIWERLVEGSIAYEFEEWDRTRD